MKVTKRQLRRIIESSYEEIARIRDSGDYSWRDMEYEVVDLIDSMKSVPAEDVITIMYDALDAPDREDEAFWQSMLSTGGNLYQALDGLKATADEEYDPDIPMSERANRKLNEGAREMAALLAAIDDIKDRHGQEYTIDVLKSLIGEMEDGQYEHMGYYQD